MVRRQIYIYTFLITLLLSITALVYSQYCTPCPTNGPHSTYQMIIESVVLENIDYESTAYDECYNDLTVWGYKTNLGRGEAYSLAVKTGASSYYYGIRYAAWIDYNNDNDFEDAGEKLGEQIPSAASAVMSFPFVVPAGATVGPTRMRVRCVWGYDDINSCTNYSYGETEDYIVGISDFGNVSTGISGIVGNISFYNHGGDYDYDLISDDLTYGSSDPIVTFYNSSSNFYQFDYISGAMPDLDVVNMSYMLADLTSDYRLDLLLTYRDHSDLPQTVYYRNGGYFYLDDLGLPDLMRGSTAAADLNNDGRVDIILCGQDASELPWTYIYENTGSGFVMVKDDLPGVYGQIVTADYDNDMDIDILLTGNDRYGNSNALLFRNDNNWNFTKIFTSLDKVGWLQKSEFGDFNNDGLLDVVVGEGIFKNNGDDSFTKISLNDVDYLSNYSAQWCDMDLDGVVELVSEDETGMSLFKYNGTDAFNRHLQLFSNPESFDIADYNEDNKPDIVLGSYYDIGLHKNKTPVSNVIPSAPANLQSSVGDSGYYSVNLSWNAAVDDHTPSAGLSYNLRVGTTSGGIDIVASMTYGNELLLPGLGNVYQNKSWFLQGLDPGTYYWSVQAVDNTKLASPFASQQQFTILEPFTLSTPLWDGTIAPGGAGADFNNDGKKDIVIKDTNLSIFKQGSPTSFAEYAINPNYVLVEIADLNRDNLLDMIVTESNTKTVLCYNNGDFSFTAVDLENEVFNSAACADFDNDGDIDILAHKAGYFFYENDGANNYSAVDLGLSEELYIVNISATDIDLDNDIDFIISGNDSQSGFSANKYTYIYKNNGEFNFELSQEIIPALGPSTFMLSGFFQKTLQSEFFWNDYNFDGYQDLAITGDDNFGNANHIIFQNDGTGQFTPTDISPRPTNKFSASWVDINTDGYIDLIMPKNTFDVDHVVYLNNENQGMEAFPIALDDITTAMYLEAIDIDSDSDKDIVCTNKISTGADTYRTETVIYTNNYNFTNKVPKKPESISSEIDSFTVHLSWAQGLDDLTRENGMTYNLRVGTAADDCDIISPMSDLSTGVRLIERPGNVGSNLSWTLENLPLGTYYWAIQAVDNSFQGGAWSSMGTFEISALTAEFENDTVCLGMTTQLTDISVSTGTIDAWYWDFDDGTYSTLQNPQHSFSQSGNNPVKLRVTSGVIKDSIIQNVFVKPVPEAGFTSDIVCQGEATPFINTTNTNGLSISAWHWDFDDGATDDVQDPGTHGYLLPGDYNVQLSVTADNGCSDVTSSIATVGVFPVAGITVSGNPEFCTGDSVVLSNEFTPSYLYQWKIYGSNLSGADSNRFVAKISGDYTVEVTNPIGSCIDVSDPLVVTANTAPSAPTISSGSSTTFCAGDSVEVSVTYFANYTYQWKLNGGAVGANSNSFYAKIAGNYTVDVTNSSGCLVSSENSMNVIVNTSPAIPTVSVSGATTFCDGESVNLSVSNDPAMDYQWYNGAVTVGGAITNSFDADVAGDYKLTITNASGCMSETTPVAVLVNPTPASPTISLSSGDTFCEGGSVTLSVTDDPLLSYQWRLNGGATGADQNTHIVSASGSYSLEITNGSGCLATSTNTPIVTVNANPTIPTVNVSGVTAFCEGQSVGLSVTNNPLMTYQWMDGDLNVNGATTNSYTASATGEYKLRITNASDCYSETQVVGVIADPAPTAPTIGYSGALEFCDTESLELSVADNPNYTYEWLLNGGTVGINNSSYVANASGDYTVKVQNLGDCSVMSVNTVSLIVHTSPTNPTLNLSGTTTFCEDASLTISVANIGADNYQWISELGEMPGEEETSVTVNETGLYKVRVTNAGSCESFSQEIAVTVNDYPGTPVILTENYVPENCMGDDPIVLSVQTIENDVSYQWSRNGNVINGATSDSYSGYLDEGSYKVEADNNGCALESAPQTISYAEMPDKPEILAEGPNIWYLACSNDSATAYKWYLNGEEIEGAIEFLYVAGTQQGKFEVAVSINGSCFAKSDPLWIPLGTGIEQDPWQNLKIYPNPTPGMFTLEMDNHIMGELVIDIFGETGAQIINIKFHKETAHFKTQVDLSGQPAGAYLIGLMLEKYRTTRTLIVE